MSSNNVIIRNHVGLYTNSELEHHERITYSGPSRVVCQKFIQPGAKAPNKYRKIIQDISYSLPHIAIKKEDANSQIVDELQIALINGCWDTSNKIPNIVAEMPNLKTEDIKVLQNTCNTNSAEIRDSCVDLTNPSPTGSDSGIESDCAEGNLSWLLNYKIHELPPVPADFGDMTTSTAEENINVLNQTDFEKSVEIKNIDNEYSRGSGHSYRYSGPKKPPFTYTELIEHALSEKGELTVSGIYHWISEHFPFYKQNDDRWKNSVRHNLSINPHFRKGSKSVHGAGHLWTIAQKDDKKSFQIKQRMQQFIQTAYKDRTQEQDPLDIELQAATASILGESFNDYNSQQINNNQSDSQNGTKKNIEVEFVNVAEVPNGLEDFLSPPVSKQQLVQECGLGNDYLITDLNPNALGLNLAEAEVIAADGLYDDMTLEYYQLEK